MRQLKFTETKMVSILKGADAQRPVHYKWKAKYGGLEASEVKRLKRACHAVSWDEQRTTGRSGTGLGGLRR